MVLGEGGFVKEEVMVVPRNTELLPEFIEIYNLSQIIFLVEWAREPFPRGCNLKNVFLVDFDGGRGRGKGGGSFLLSQGHWHVLGQNPHFITSKNDGLYP